MVYKFFFVNFCLLIRIWFGFIVLVVLMVLIMVVYIMGFYCYCFKVIVNGNNYFGYIVLGNLELLVWDLVL